MLSGTTQGRSPAEAVGQPQARPLGRHEPPILQDDRARRGVLAQVEVAVQVGVVDVRAGQGELETALQQFLQVTYLHASELMWSTTACVRVALICEQLEDYDDVVKLYQKIADAHKGQIQGEFARKKLEELSGLETP